MCMMNQLNAKHSSVCQTTALWRPAVPWERAHSSQQCDVAREYTQMAHNILIQSQVFRLFFFVLFSFRGIWILTPSETLGNVGHGNLERRLSLSLDEVGDVHWHLVNMRVVECLDILQHTSVLVRHKIYSYTLPTETTASPNPETHNSPSPAAHNHLPFIIYAPNPLFSLPRKHTNWTNIFVFVFLPIPTIGQKKSYVLKNI